MRMTVQSHDDEANANPLTLSPLRTRTVSGRAPQRTRKCIPEAENLSVPNFFEAAASRFCVLAGDSADADDRKSCAPHEDEREGQNEANFGGDVFLRRCYIRCDEDIRTLTWVQASKLSAQSPAWRINA